MRTLTGLLLLSAISSVAGCTGEVTIAAFPGDGGGGGSSGGSSGGTPGDSGVALCRFGGTTYSDGAQFPSGDGCNTCFCNQGSIGCTTVECLGDSGPANLDASGPPAGLPITGTATGTELYTPSQVQAARANCDLAHGPAVSTITIGDKRALLVGSWLICSATMPGPGFPITRASVAFTADGHWYALLLDASGGLVHGYGVENEGTYMIGDYPDASDSQPLNGDYNVYEWLAAGGGNAAVTSFEEAPQRMDMSIYASMGWYVPLQ